MDKVKAADFKRICKICIENGVKSLKMNGLEVEFHEQRKGLGIAPALSASNTPAISDLGTSDEEAIPPTEDELLFWSSGYSPQTQRKEAFEHEESA